MGSIPTKEDFENGPLRDHGVTVSLTPVTKTTNNTTGSIERTDGTPFDISIVFENPSIVLEIIKQGEQTNSTVRAFVKGDVSINIEDKITWNGSVFRTEDISPQYFGANLIFKTLTMTLITP